MSFASVLHLLFALLGLAAALVVGVLFLYLLLAAGVAFFERNRDKWGP